MADTHDAAAIENRSSIDLSLELERQLDSESLPPDSPGFPNGENRASLDPHVLAHIVTQLRDSVTHITRERDDLVHQLAESHSREAESKDSLALSTERCANLEKEVETLRAKSQDDEEAISMLRSKVEESRRGLMRLQSERNAENKRMTLDLTNARTPSFGGGAPRSSNRASFTPLTGSGHPGPPSSFRRTSSNNAVETDPGFAEFVAGLPGSPGQTLIINDSADSSSTSANRRRSMFGATNRSSTSQLEGRPSPSNLELDSLKQELAAARAALEETRHELSESNEAREASETCVQALRDFIGNLGTGETGSAQGTQTVRLPPLPSESHVKDPEPEPKPKSTGWGGLKLWRVDTGSSAPSPASASTPHPPPVAGRQSMESYRSTSSQQESTSPSTAVPLKNKFGAFFTRGTAVGSTSHPPPQSHQEEPMLNGSDVSSSTEDRSEPTSPVAERVQPVFVREALSEVAEGANEETGGDEGNYTPHEADDNDTMKIAPHTAGDHDTMNVVPL